MKMREIPMREKPREKLLRSGKESLSTTELLALLLRTGTAGKSAMELAGEVLSLDERGLRFLTECVPEELQTVNGM